MSQIIAIYNFKGGVGKTTSAYFISGIISREKKVLVIDADPQCNLTGLFLSVRKENHDFKNDLFKYLVNIIHHREVSYDFTVVNRNLHYLAGNYDIIELESNSRFIEFGDSIISKFIDSLKKEYDVIIFDCPSYFGKIVKNILANVDHVIIPMTPDVYSVKGLLTMIKKIKHSIKIKPQFFAGAFLTMFRSDYKYHKKIKTLCKRIFKNLVLDSSIRNSVVVNKPVDTTLFEVDKKNNKVMKDYEALVHEIQCRLMALEKIKPSKKVSAESAD